jgi:hypothetical protein
MKLFETRFDEYVTTSAQHNFHPKLKTMIEKFPSNIQDLKNIIIYGPSGVGKYTQALNIIYRYSPSGLKYEKKTIIPYCNNKSQYICKISDIHYEIDMSLLGCNAKTLWHDIYGHILDIVGGTNHKTGIILCKNMHLIDHDLMETLFSYMQDISVTNPIQIRFVFISEGVSFLPDNIVQCCEIIPIPKPRLASIKKHVRKRNSTITDDSISRTMNIKSLYSPISHNQTEVFEIIVRNITSIILGGIDNIVFSELRECIYDLFVYGSNIHICMWCILSTLINTGCVDDSIIDICIEDTFEFFKLYNNNYRPIYHVEAYLYKIMLLIHEKDMSEKSDVGSVKDYIDNNDVIQPKNIVVKDIDISVNDM